MFLPEEDLIPFLACLGLGTLRAIRAGALHPDVGIWTLAVPGFRIPLEERRNLPRELLEVFGAADELSAIKDLGGQARFEEVLDGQIRVLERILAASPESSWSLRWANEAEPPRGG
jgi:hypothetical protein